MKASAARVALQQPASARRSVSRTVVRMVVLAVVLAGGWNSLSPRVAVAGEYAVNSCATHGDYETRLSTYWGFSSNNPNARRLEGCPDFGLGFEIVGELPRDSRFSWTYGPSRMTTAIGVTLTIEGGDTSTGIEYSVAACADCAPIVVLPQRSSGDPAQTLMLALPSISTFVVRGECTADTCAPANGLRIHDLTFVMRDDAPPVVSGPRFYSAVVPGEPLPVELSYGWNRLDFVDMKFSVNDSGIGLHTVSATLRSVTSGNSQSIFNGWYCSSLTNFQGSGSWSGLCPASTGQIERWQDMRGLPDGQYEFRVDAMDAFGNAMTPIARQFKFDGTPPAEPANVVVSGENENGWLTNTMIDLSWDNTGETYAGSATESGIQSAWYDVEPLSSGQSDPPPVETTGYLSFRNRIDDIQLPSEGEWRLDLWTEDFVGNVSPKHHVDLRVDNDVPPPPQLLANAPVNRAALYDGYRQQWRRPAITAANESGICGYAMAIDTRPATVPPPFVTVPGDAVSAVVPPNIAAGLHFVHLRTVSCGGRASAETATAELLVDDTSPQVSVAGLPSTEWSTTAVELTISASDLLSSVDHVYYSLDGATSQTVTGPLARLIVRSGVHSLAFGAVDQTGNRSNGAPVTVKVDEASPEVWFEPIDPAHPTRIEASIGDSVSGVETAWLEYQRADASASADEAVWRSLGTPVHAGEADGAHIAVTGRLPDDRLADGLYAVRVVATDRAGNVVRSGRMRPDGASTLIALPARERPLLTAGVAGPVRRCTTTGGKLCTKRTRCNKSGRKCIFRMVIGKKAARPLMEVPFNTKTGLFGELRRANGTPVAGARLKVYAAPKGGRATLAGETVTDLGGEYEFPIPPGVTRVFTVRYVGADTLAPVDSAPAAVAVRAGVKLTPLRHTVRSGKTFTVEGRLRSGEADIPDTGKLVVVEYYIGRGRAPVVIPGRTDLRGRFSVSHSLASPMRHAVRVKIRATVPTEATWPYVDGSSPAQTLLVRP